MNTSRISAFPIGLHRLGLPWLALALGLMLSGLPATAAPPKALPRAVQKEADAMRAVLEANFQACNHEDVEGLLDTMATSMQGRPEFAKEATDTFEQTDAYFRLADFQLVEYRPPFATARVVQITLPKDEKDRTTGTNQQIYYRGLSALLPRWECVVYLQRFEKRAGQWKVHMIATEPQPAVWPPPGEKAGTNERTPAE